MTAVIEIQGLRKTYRGRRRRRLALDGLDLVVERGGVHGLLGPNGAGKTTALRVLFGLARADAGTMSLFGEPVPPAWPRVVHRVGATVQGAQWVGGRSGRRSLRLLATAGEVPRTRVDQVLELVGLRERAGDPVASYPPAARQRLTVAAALLKSPELLVLDEPAAGLDPAAAGMLQELLRGLAATGVTVLVASHVFAEAEKLFDTVTVIAHGRRVATGAVAEVLAHHDRGEFRVRVAGVSGSAADPAESHRAVAIIAETGLPVAAYEDHFIVGDLADAGWISKTLARHGLWVTELTPMAPSLASIFRGLTRVDSPAAPPRPGASATGGQDAPQPDGAHQPDGADAPAGADQPGGADQRTDQPAGSHEPVGADAPAGAEGPADADEPDGADRLHGSSEAEEVRP